MVAATQGASSVVAEMHHGRYARVHGLGDANSHVYAQHGDQMIINDIGPRPHSFDIERATKENTDYRSVAWSGRYLQVTLMSIPVGEDVGLEVHPETDQFLRLDAGRGRVQMGVAKDQLTFESEVSDGWCVVVPAGTWHNITNIGTTPMQVYAVYAPAHHKPGKVHASAAAAEADQDDEPAAWSVQPSRTPDEHG